MDGTQRGPGLQTLHLRFPVVPSRATRERGPVGLTHGCPVFVPTGDVALLRHAQDMPALGSPERQLLWRQRGLGEVSWVMNVALQHQDKGRGLCCGGEGKATNAAMAPWAEAGAAALIRAREARAQSQVPEDFLDGESG